MVGQARTPIRRALSARANEGAAHRGRTLVISIAGPPRLCDAAGRACCWGTWEVTLFGDGALYAGRPAAAEVLGACCCCCCCCCCRCCWWEGGAEGASLGPSVGKGGSGTGTCCSGCVAAVEARTTGAT